MAFFGLFKSKEEKQAESEITSGFDEVREKARAEALKQAEEDKVLKRSEYERALFEKEQKAAYDKEMAKYQNVDIRTGKEKFNDFVGKLKEKGQQAGAALSKNIGQGYGNVQRNLGGTGTQFSQDVGKTFKGAGSGFIQNIEKNPKPATTSTSKKDDKKKKEVPTAIQSFTRSITTPQAATQQINLQGAAERPSVLNRGTQPLFTPKFGAQEVMTRRGQPMGTSRIDFLMGKRQDQQQQQGQPKPMFNGMNLLGSRQDTNSEDRVNKLRRFL